MALPIRAVFDAKEQRPDAEKLSLGFIGDWDFLIDDNLIAEEELADFDVAAFVQFVLHVHTPVRHLDKLPLQSLFPTLTRPQVQMFIELLEKWWKDYECGFTLKIYCADGTWTLSKPDRP